MNEWINLDVHVDKNKNIILVPFKTCEAGYGVAADPIMQVGSEEWDNISQYILDLLY